MDQEFGVDAQQLLAAGDNEAARAEFIKILAQSPEDINALLGLGKSLSRLEHYSESLEIYEQALTIDPDLAEAHHNVGWILHFQMKNWREAEVHIKRAVALAPDVAKHHVLAIESARKRRDTSATLMHLKALRQIYPEKFDNDIRLRGYMTSLRISSFVDKLFTPLILFLIFTMPVYACWLLSDGYKWGITVGALPFGLAAVGYALERRSRLALVALGTGVLWVILAYLFAGYMSR